MKYKLIAKQIIINNLSAGETSDGIRDICEINFGNDDVLLEHISAIINIFTKAKEFMESNEKEK